jgi:glutaconate CoA-transferase subunit A
VEDLEAPGFNAVILPSWTITAIAVVPGGAYPSYTQGYYRRANRFYTEWDQVSRDRQSFQRWMQEHVLNSGPEAFLAHRAVAV